MNKTPRPVIAIPCYNEEATIAQVVRDFRLTFPVSDVFVFNNNSTDQSVMLAERAGAQIRHVRRQGKGNVMRAIFDSIRTDILIVVDGDGTYLAEDALRLIEPIVKNEADMVVGNRLAKADKKAFAAINHIGNRVIVWAINLIFGANRQDVLSGYRVFSRKFIERVPLLTGQFETETELTIQALEEGMDIVEIPITYLPRPANSRSKLNPFRDGWKIMIAAAMLMRDHHPLRFYGLLGSICLLVSLVAGILKVTNYYETGHVSDSMLAGLILLFTPVGFIMIGIGFILSAINTKFAALKQVFLRNKDLEK